MTGEAHSVDPLPAAPNFDGLAAVYRWMEWCSFGPYLGRCRRAFLPEMRACRRALVIGDGDGRFTARLLEENPEIRIDVVDASASMLRALKRRAGPHAARIATRCMDARKWRAESGRYDLIVTHFFLDCLSTREVRALAGEICAAAAPHAVWTISEFAIPRSTYGKAVARPAISLLYRAFRWMTGLRVSRLPDYALALRESGFVLKRRRGWLRGLLVSEMWRVDSR